MASCYDRVPMADGVNFGGKREWLARGLLRSGATSLLSRLPDRDSLLVLNYHRIGDPDDDLFDPGVFSATGGGSSTAGAGGGSMTSSIASSGGGGAGFILLKAATPSSAAYRMMAAPCGQ